MEVIEKGRVYINRDYTTHEYRIVIDTDEPITLNPGDRLVVVEERPHGRLTVGIERNF